MGAAADVPWSDEIALRAQLESTRRTLAEALQKRAIQAAELDEAHAENRILREAIRELSADVAHYMANGPVPRARAKASRADG